MTEATTYEFPATLSRLRYPLLLVGIVALALDALALPWHSGANYYGADHFFDAYQYGFLFWLGVALGSMGVVMLHHLLGGYWGQLTRRLFISAALCLPVMAVLFIPMILGAKHLYPWANIDAVTDTEAKAVLLHRQPYMSIGFWVLRAVVYFAAWSGLTIALGRWSLLWDADADRTLPTKMRKASAGGMVLYVILMTLASVDWIMARDATWYSAIYGFIWVVSQTLTAIAFVVVVLPFFLDVEPLKSFVKPTYLNDLGNLLLTLVVLWAYMNISQFLVIWMGNVSDDIGFYVKRTHGGWGAIALILIFIHFFAPFLMLLMKQLKRKMPTLWLIGAFVLVMRLIDLYWQLAPFGHVPTADGYEPGDRYHLALGWESMWMFLLAWVGIGGIFMYFFIGNAAVRPLLPREEPDIDSPTTIQTLPSGAAGVGRH